MNKSNKKGGKLGGVKIQVPSFQGKNDSEALLKQNPIKLDVLMIKSL